MHPRLRPSIFLCLVLSPLVALPTAAEPQSPCCETSILVKLQLGTLDGGREVPGALYELVVVDRGGATRLQTGSRVPIPTAPSAGSQTPANYSYQHVGLSVVLRGELLDDGRLRLRGEIEESSLAEAVTTGAPTVRTVNHEINAVVRPDEPTRIGSLVDPDGAAFYLEVEAAPLL